jgi:hypothetical protein
MLTRHRRRTHAAALLYGAAFAPEAAGSKGAGGTAGNQYVLCTTCTIRFRSAVVLTRALELPGTSTLVSV